MKMSNVMRGGGGQTTIAQADIAQPLTTGPTFVVNANIYPDPSVSGNILMSYDATPYLPSLVLPTVEGRIYNLQLVQIKSDSAGDKVNWNGVVTK